MRSTRSDLGFRVYGLGFCKFRDSTVEGFSENLGV